MTQASEWVCKVLAPGGIRFVWNPTKYVNPTSFQGFDLEGWTKNQYEWAQDMRWTDSLRDPMETVNTGRGDCEDYAAVCVATLLARGKQDIVVSFHLGIPASHVTVWCDGVLYSSGSIREVSLDEFESEQGYVWSYRNRINSSS